jgi:DNA-binding MarR family transcriptional regulator
VTDPGGSADAAEAWRIMGALVLDNERRKEVSEAVGLSFGRIRALRRIAQRTMSMGELATALTTDPPYATLIVDDLEGLGLVRRRPDPADRRAKLLTVTPRGRELVRRAEKILGRPPPELAGLDPEALRSLVQLLRSAETGSHTKGSSTKGSGSKG